MPLRPASSEHVIVSSVQAFRHGLDCHKTGTTFKHGYLACSSAGRRDLRPLAGRNRSSRRGPCTRRKASLTAALLRLTMLKLHESARCALLEHRFALPGCLMVLLWLWKNVGSRCFLRCYHEWLLLGLGQNIQGAAEARAGNSWFQCIILRLSRVLS